MRIYFYLQVREQFAAVDEIHHEAELIGCLEGVVQIHQKRMHQILQNIQLGERVLNFASRDDGLLDEHLHRVDLVVVLLSNLEHLAEASLAYDAHKIEIFQAQRFRRRRHTTARGCLLGHIVDAIFLLSQDGNPRLSVAIRSTAHIPGTRWCLHGEAKLLLLVLAALDVTGANEANNSQTTSLRFFRITKFSITKNAEALLPRFPTATLLCQKSLLMLFSHN